jgi:hypothetical protein
MSRESKHRGEYSMIRLVLVHTQLQVEIDKTDLSDKLAHLMP